MATGARPGQQGLEQAYWRWRPFRLIVTFAVEQRVQEGYGDA
jgi:hypothetical protein